MKRLILLVGMMVWTIGAFAAEKGAGDPFQELFIPPELLLMHQEELGISGEQRDSIRARQEKFQTESERMQKELEKQRDELNALLKRKDAMEGELLAAFEKLLDRERDLRKAQVTFMIEVRKLLSAEQRQKASELKKSPRLGKPEFEARFKEKLERIQEGAQALGNAGVDASEVATLMEDFDPLMKQAKFKEAEAVLDRALKMIAGKKK